MRTTAGGTSSVPGVYVARCSSEARGAAGSWVELWRCSLPHDRPLLCSRCVPALLVLTGARASGDSTWSWVDPILFMHVSAMRHSSFIFDRT